MLLHKKLIPSTEKDILKEISEELNIKYNDVEKTYDIWLSYLNDISNEEDQNIVNISSLGKMYLSYHRLKGNKDKEWENKKKKQIEKEIPDKYYNDHRNLLPVNVIYGVGRNNFALGKNEYNKFEYFTKEELIRRQNKKFFDEDREFSDRKDIYEYFFNDIPKQELINYECYPNNKGET